MTDEPLDEEMLLELQRRTRNLPREIEPPAGAWERIAADMRVTSPIRVRNPFWQRPGFLIAASFILVAATSITTTLVIGRNPNASPSVARVSPSRPSGGPATLVEFTARENEYIATVNVLSAALESKEVGLAPETIAKLKASVRIIDNAILEARSALARDPSNKALIEMLATSYDQKVDLLKRTTEMASL